MGDLALRWDLATGTMDLAMAEDDLASDEGLQTAVLLSLFLDARAEPEDQLLDNNGDRRGWCLDELNEMEGDRYGSRRWLVTERGKLTPDITRQIQVFDAAALQWLLEDGVASAVNVTAEIIDGHLRQIVHIDRPGRGRLSFRYDHAWNAEAANAL